MIVHKHSLLKQKNSKFELFWEKYVRESAELFYTAAQQWL